MKKLTPEQAARSLYQALMQNQCDVSWKVFSKESQKVFIKWTLEDIYQRHSHAAEGAQLSEKEVRLMFENNDPTVMKSFWKRFFFSSNAANLFRYGYFLPAKIEGNQAQVPVHMMFPDGRTEDVSLTMVKEWSDWKLAYTESGLPF